MENYVIITAGGSGKRINSDFPKQFIPVAGKPLLLHTMEVFRSYDARMHIILVLPEEHIPLWKDLCTEFDIQIEHQIVRGGEHRFHSVQNGINHVPPESLVLIHDGVRPLIHHDTIDRVIKTATEKGNAVPCVLPSQSVRQINDDGSSHPVNRDMLRMIQTPQAFHSDIIKQAYNQVYRPEFTDDATVLESLGETINLVQGNYSNIKVTHPGDLKIVEAMLTID